MSSTKTKKKEVVKTSVKLEDVTIHNVPKTAEKFLKKLGATVAILVAIVATKGLFLLKAGAAKLSMLYLLGDNGLKSGRASGNVYLRNGRIRQFRVPRLVRNLFTSTARAVFGSFSSLFKGLSPDQIAAWNNYFGTASDRFGRAIEVTGKQAYIRLNALITSVGGTPIDIPPGLVVAPDPTLNIAIGTLSALAFSVEYDINPTGATTQIWATRGLSPGVTRPGKTQFRLIGTIDTSVTAPANINAAYAFRFGVKVSGTQIFIQMKVIDATTGLASAITQSAGQIVS